MSAAGSGVPPTEAVAWFDTDHRRDRVAMDTAHNLARFERETGHVLRWPVGLDPPTVHAHGQRLAAPGPRHAAASGLG